MINKRLRLLSVLFDFSGFFDE